MSELATNDAAAVLENVIIKGDLAQLSPKDRVLYYNEVCRSVGLNPFTKPLEYIKLNGKLTLYALKGATDQLRSLHKISIEAPKIDYAEDLIIVSVVARDATGRTDADSGAVVIGNLKGEAKANAIMKAITKAKRRVTLSMCGLGLLDETEVETIPEAQAWQEPKQEPVKAKVEEAKTEAPKQAQKAVWESWRSKDDPVHWAVDQTDDHGSALFNHHNHAQNSYDKARREYLNSLTKDEQPKDGDDRETKWRHSQALNAYFFEKIQAKKRGEDFVLPAAGSQRIFEDIGEAEGVSFEAVGA